MTYKNLAYIVHSVLSERGESSTVNYQRFLQLSYRGYRDLNLFVGMPNIKTVYLPVSTIGTIDLPDDYIDYRAIGLCRNGRIHTLTLARDLCLKHNLNECCEVEELEEQTSGLNDTGAWLYQPSWRNGSYVGEQYGVGGGVNSGYYRIDEKNWRIQLSSVAPQTEIVLEYLSSGADDCNGDRVVPEYAVESLISWVHWKAIENNPDVPLHEKNRARDAYYINYQKATLFVNSFTADEFLDNYYSTIRSTPKR